MQQSQYWVKKITYRKSTRYFIEFNTVCFYFVSVDSTPTYLESPNAKTRLNIDGSNHNPNPQPVSFPNTLANLNAATIVNTGTATKLTTGIMNNNNSHGLSPTIWNSTTLEYIGIIDAQPGLPAFLNCRNFLTQFLHIIICRNSVKNYILRSMLSVVYL